jgi:hypothetical protein
MLFCYNIGGKEKLIAKGRVVRSAVRPQDCGLNVSFSIGERDFRFSGFIAPL